MKKLLSIATLLAALSGAASAAPYVLPGNMPGNLTPYDIQPVYSVEGLYGIADESSEMDTYGVRLRLSLYSDAATDLRHQFSINLAGMWGSEDGVDLFMMPVTAGYDLNMELSDSVMFYISAKAGYCFGDLDAGGDSADASGFTYSVGAGLKFQCSESIYLNVGYEFGRTYFDTSEVDDIYGQHIISVGIGCQF